MLHRVARVIAFCLVSAIFCVQVVAQQLPNLTADQLQRLQQLQQPQNGALSALGAGLGDFGQQQQQQPMVLQPAVPPRTTYEMQPSRLEQIMSARAGVVLRQFGYNQLGTSSAVTVPQTGAVQDDYVVGPGDEIVVILRGGEVNTETHALVDRNGQVVLPRLGPISASGRSFGSFRQDVQAAVGRAYVATQASVSIARMRQISVLVTGAVNIPGLRLVTGLSSALDAILLSGGISKTGSLRDIRVTRGGRQYNVDLYNVLGGDNGETSAMRLADGDRIFVAPLGRTVAVTGLVRNPGIYELPKGQLSIPARNLISLAGGPEVNGNFIYSLLRLQPDGRLALVQLKDLSETVGDGEMLSAQFQADQTTARITLSGATALASDYPIASGTKLSEFIRRPGAIGTTPYTLFGLISRRDPRTLLRSLVAFTPAAILNGSDMILQSDDIVRPISVTEMRMLVTNVHDYDQWRGAQEEAVRNPIATANMNGVPQSGAIPRNGPQAAGVPQTAGVPPQAGISQSDLGRAGMTQQGAAGEGQAQSGMVAGAILNAANSAQDAAANQQSVVQALAGRSYTGANNGAYNGANSGAYNGAYDSSYNGAAAAGQPQNYPPISGVLGPNAFVAAAPNFQTQIASPGNYPLNREAMTFEQLAQQLGVDPLVLMNFLVGDQVTVDGAVRGPGTYFVGPDVTLRDLVLAAGDTTNWLDASGVELISTDLDSSAGRSVSRVTRLPLTSATLASYIVKPRDSFRFNEVFADVNVGSATLQGEVRFTGSYKLTRGEHLSDLLTRAGGLTATAYPYGTVFLRKSAAASEQEGYVRAAKEVEDQLVVAMTRVGNDKIDPATFATMQTFVAELRNQKALGRIAISADPSVLAANPSLDPLLESGDVIYIPPRPSTISVLGQVMQPGGFPYRAGASVGDYVERSGGYSRLADEGQVFLVLPDGTARKVEKSWLRFDAATSVPPGSAIVVPRDVTPLDMRQTIIDVSQILSQLAVSIASVAVLSKQ